MIGLEFTVVSLLKGTLLSGKCHFYWNLAKEATAKAQGTTAIAVGAMGYFEVYMYHGKFIM